jgi:predicted DNA binding CopG/RHH family protein
MSTRSSLHKKMNRVRARAPKNLARELAPKDISITFRLSEALLQDLRAEADRLGTRYQKVLRAALEAWLQSQQRART